MLKQSRSKFHRVLCKVKNKYRQNFLQAKEENQNEAKIYPEENNRSWSVLKYTKLLRNITTFIFNESNNELAITMQNKKQLVKADAFFHPLIFHRVESQSKDRTASLFVK